MILIKNYNTDLKRIMIVIFNNGYELDFNTCSMLWEDYSDSFNEEWLPLPENDDQLWLLLKWRIDNLSN